MVIISAAILGSLVGFGTATLLSVQIYMFIELPPQIDFPFFILSVMLLIAFLTTYFAVWHPMQYVNRKTIAATIKASA